MANPAVVVDFVANTKDLQRGFQSASGKAAGFKSKLAGLAKAGALAGLAALAATVKTGADEFAEAQKVTAQTEAVLKSTGKAANVTAKDVGNLAEALMNKTGIDDEAIQSGENLLLTFTNIRNEAGKGNDVFNQTTKAAVDMSVALGTDMKSASMQLGKALNDPIKGVTKLTRSGVTFTDAQKKQITALQESGKTMEAQKIILAEVNKEFGGSAKAAGKTLPGQLNILKQQFSNLAGELVGRMVPVLLAIAKFLNQNRTAVIAVVGVLAALVAGVYAVNAAMAVYRATTALVTGATKAWAAAQWLVNAAMRANPIGIVITVIAALVAALIIAYKTSDKFRAIVDKAFAVVLNAAKAVWKWLKANWPLLLAIIAGPVGAAAALVIRNWDKIKQATSTAWNAIKTAVSTVAGSIRNLLSSLKDWLAGAFLTAVKGAVNKVGKAFDAIKDGARDAYEAVRNVFNNMVSWISNLVSRVAGVAGRVANALKSPINAVIGAWNSLGIPRVSITLPSKTILGKKIGGGSFGFGPFPFPDISKLAAGGIVTRPTLALIGEAGPEAVLPLNQGAAPAIEVRVFIGDTELKGLVRSEIVDANTGLARSLLAGTRTRAA